MNRSSIWFATTVSAFLLILIIWWNRSQSIPESPLQIPTEKPSEWAIPTPPSKPTTASTSDPAEVFRRAFWRQPSTEDHIINALRHINPSDKSWQWYIQLHPSKNLIQSLKNPDIFGLIPLPQPLDSPLRGSPNESSPPPAWFPDMSTLDLSPFEILISPSTNLIVLYHHSDNLLFASDFGDDFAPAIY